MGIIYELVNKDTLTLTCPQLQGDDLVVKEICNVWFDVKDLNSPLLASAAQPFKAMGNHLHSF